MEKQLVGLYGMGIRRFYVGGEMGVDLWAGKILVNLNQIQEYSDIRLTCTRPFLGYNNPWDEKSRRRQAALETACDEVITVSDVKTPVAYKLRNYYMVDHAAYLLAVFDTDGGSRSGTAQVVNYAHKNKRAITFIHPDTLAVTQERV